MLKQQVIIPIFNTVAIKKLADKSAEISSKTANPPSKKSIPAVLA
jgi:hypothetical protein